MTKTEIESAIACHAPQETLYDQPLIDRSKFRVSGPFTVEAVPAVKVETLSGEILNGTKSLIKQDWFFALKTQGIKAKTGLSKDIEFTRLEVMSDTQYIYAEGETKEAKPKRAIVCFSSEYAPLEQRQVEEALKEAKPYRPELVIFCAFQFDPEAGKDVDELDLRWTKVLKSEINEELIDNFKGTESIPFKAENHKKIAIKIIDDRGIESLVIKPLD